MRETPFCKKGSLALSTKNSWLLLRWAACVASRPS